MDIVESTHNCELRKNFQALHFSEKLVVWSIRIWMRDFKLGSNCHKLLQDCYTLARVPDAYPYLNTIMTIYASLDECITNISCIKCPKISNDENLFLTYIGELQANTSQNSNTFFLNLWMPMVARRRIQSPAKEFASILKNKKLLLSTRSQEFKALTIKTILDHKQNDYSKLRNQKTASFLRFPYLC